MDISITFPYFIGIPDDLAHHRAIPVYFRECTSSVMEIQSLVIWGIVYLDHMTRFGFKHMIEWVFGIVWCWRLIPCTTIGNRNIPIFRFLFDQNDGVFYILIPSKPVGILLIQISREHTIGVFEPCIVYLDRRVIPRREISRIWLCCWSRCRSWSRGYIRLSSRIIWSGLIWCHGRIGTRNCLISHVIIFFTSCSIGIGTIGTIFHFQGTTSTQ